MKIILLSVCLFFGLAYSNAQLVEINDIKSSKFTGVNPIHSGQDGDIEGYCVYYMVDKESKGNRVFEFQIIDKNLSETVTTNINLHKNAQINNAVFNGQYLLISVDDAKNKQIKLYMINKDGKIVKEQTIATEKRRLAESVIYADKNGQGFYVVRPSDNKKDKGYILSKLDNQLEQVWKNDEPAMKGSLTVQDVISTNGQLVIWQQFLQGSKVKPSILCLNPLTGDKVYEHECYDGTNTLLYNNIKIDTEGNVYAGGAYVKGEKIKGVNNTGVYLLKLSKDGKQLLYNNVDNKEKIQDVLKKTNTSFALGSKDKVLVEDLLLVDDKIIIVSEMFRKNTNITPAAVQQTRDLITGKYIGTPGGGSQPSQKGKFVMDIRDYIFFSFNQEGKLIDIIPGLKEDNNKITCWYPYVSLPGMQLANELQRVGWFDYGFKTHDANGEPILVCKDNTSGSKPAVYTYNLNKGYIKNNIDLKQQAKVNLDEGKVSYFNILKNSDGNMLTVYYQRKLKKITLSLETL